MTNLTMPIGDGVHDDTSAIQALLDSGLSTVRLPSPTGHYAISQALHIHSNTSLILDGFTTVRLMDGANSHMLVADDGQSENISVSGGIWDFNNQGQAPNPMRIPPEDGDYAAVTHFIFYFENVKNLYVGDLTMKDPTIFASTFDHVEQFTVQNITFDFNLGKPNATNMDGIHLNGSCRFGRITNLKGACYDDMVALNADEGKGGPIEDIQIDGLFCEGCHSAVRLLSRGWPVRRVHISNVFGTFFQYCVGITRYSDDGREGVFDQVHLSDIYASKAPRLPVHGKEGGYVYALIWIEGGLTVGNLQIDHLHRREAVTAIPTLSIMPGADIKVLGLEHISQENETGEEMPVILNRGSIGKMYLRDVQEGGDILLENNGIISKIISVENC